MVSQFQMLGFCLAGFFCLLLAVLKLTKEGHWSWWRVLLSLWVVLGHNALYIAVGFVRLLFADDGAAGEEATVRHDKRPVRLPAGGHVVFSPTTCSTNRGNWRDHVAGLRSGRWELILAFGVLSVVCQLLFWSVVVRPDNRRTWEK
jgi:hypothetical protein